jgi:YfiH family protein
MSSFDVSLPFEARFTLRGSDVVPDPLTMAVAHQVHGDRVAWVAAPGLVPATDGLITATDGLTLGIKVADCAAILFCDPIAGVSAAVHAGWRGAVGGIHRNALRMMTDAGCDLNRIHAWISPCIGIASFEVGEEVAERFPARFVHRAGFAKPHVDLGGYLVHELDMAGLSASQIHFDGRCTVEHSDIFWSYRREAQDAGRMMALITNRHPR